MRPCLWPHNSNGTSLSLFFTKIDPNLPPRKLRIFKLFPELPPWYPHYSSWRILSRNYVILFFVYIINITSRVYVHWEQGPCTLCPVHPADTLSNMFYTHCTDTIRASISSCLPLFLQVSDVYSTHSSH